MIGLVVGRFAFLGTAQDDVGATGAPPTSGGRDLPAALASLAVAPDDPDRLTRVGLSYLTEARRTADPSYYGRAEAAIGRARSLDPSAAPATVAAGLLALARHDFAGALELAAEARRLVPLSVDPLGVEVDALVELGRYDEAAASVDEMVRRRPDVASLSRSSYVAELRGDGAGALASMQQAVAAAGDRGADAAYVTALLGDLQLGRGNVDAASSAYARALRLQPGQPQAELGRARVHLARGEHDDAAQVLAALTDRLPLPDAVALQGDVRSFLGDAAGAAERYELVRAIEDLSRSQGGVAVDLELARFEAGRIGHPDGEPEHAIALARAARAARPTVFGDDVLAWALHRAGRSAEAQPLAASAVRFGTGDATLWWHLAAVDAAVGDLTAARDHLTRAFDIGGPLPLLERAEARSLATRLGVPAPA